jgi:Response regulators consisting of a CheY-like receiver domain and a winged-helix DNA-binding domain
MRQWGFRPDYFFCFEILLEHFLQSEYREGHRYEKMLLVNFWKDFFQFVWPKGEHIMTQNTDARLAQLKGARILVADDNEINKILAEGILGSAGFEVDFASTEGELVERAKVGSYALILVDCYLPPEDGWSAIAALQGAGISGVPVVALTTDFADAQKGAGLAIAGTAEKTYDAEVLLSTVAQFAALPAAAPAAPSAGSATGTDGTPFNDGRPIIDFVEGVTRVAGNRGLLEKLLKRIAGEINGNIDSMSNAIQANNMDELRGLAHTLKGSAGNLSVTYVYERSRNLEDAAKANDAAAAKDRLDDLRFVAQEFIAEAAKLG